MPGHVHSQIHVTHTTGVIGTNVAADNEDGGETGGITGVMETNVAAMGILMGSSTTIIGQIVGSGIVHTEIETRPAFGLRQGRPKPANWGGLTKRQRRNWYMHKNY